MNVMIIILESFGRENFGIYNQDLENGGYKGYTPFLDTLAGKRSFTQMYSYGNGRKSIDAPISVLMSVPAIPEPFVLSSYFNNQTRPLPVLLREKGYETAFFCGHPNGTMGYAALSRLIGFHRYFGMNEYGNDADYDGVWGIWDEEFMQFTLKEMNKLSQPFLSTLFTVTSHGPYQLPKHREADFEHGTEPIHRCIRYTDEALRRFFKEAENQPWYENTLFVLVADHIGAITHDEYKTSPELFAVPVIFYKPGGSLRKTEYRVSQQIDIMPTVLDYLSYDEPYLAFGFNLNRIKDNFAFNYFNGIYQLITDQYLLIFDGEKSTGLYELRTDKLLTVNLVSTRTKIVEELECKAKAFLQQYTTRMIDNRLAVR
jgi:phosphoglycerol transferase MdoB-like AlkP superfamily enzyme